MAIASHSQAEPAHTQGAISNGAQLAISMSQVVREHYLRDDIWSGSPLDPECDPSAVKLAPDAQHYLAVDTNVVLSQVGSATQCHRSKRPRISRQ